MSINIFLYVLACMFGLSVGAMQEHKITQQDIQKAFEQMGVKNILEPQKSDNNIHFLNVALQGGSCGGFESCGYHALKNGIVFAQWLNNVPMWNLLTDKNLVNKLFGTAESRWRKHVIASRRSNVLWQAFHNGLMRMLVDSQVYEQKPNISDIQSLNLREGWIYLKPLSKENSDLSLQDRKIFASICMNVAKKLADQVGSSSQALTIVSPSLIMKTLQKELELFVQKNQEKYGHLKSEDCIKSYMPRLDTLSFLVTPKSIFMCHKNGLNYHLIKQTLLAPFLSRSHFDHMGLQGEQLDDGELKELVNFEKKQDDSIFKTSDIPVITLSNMAQFNELVYLLEEYTTLIEQLRASTNKTVIALINMDEVHWISCVIQKKNKKLNYFFADSLGIDSLHKYRNKLKELTQWLDNQIA